MSGLWTAAPQGLIYAALAAVPMLAKRAKPTPALVRKTTLRDGQCWWTP